MAEPGARRCPANEVKLGKLTARVSLAGSRLWGGVSSMGLLTEALKPVGALVGLVDGVLTFPSKASGSGDEHERGR